MAYNRPEDLKKKLVKDTNVIPINCKFSECPSWDSCPQIPYQGKLLGEQKAKVFFLFEGCAAEDNVGMPLVSSAGTYFRNNFLFNFIQSSGPLSYLNVHLVANTLVKPEGGSRPATANEIHVCWFNFLEVLLKHRPKLIVCFGSGIFEVLYKRAKNKSELPHPEDHKISKLRKALHQIALLEDYKPTIICTYSPAFVLRNPTTGEFLDEDRRLALSVLKPDQFAVEKIKPVSIDQINVVESVKEALDFIDFLCRGFTTPTPIAFDIETRNLNRVYNNEILSLQFCYELGKAFILPIEHPDRNFFKDPRDLVKLCEAMQKLFSAKQKTTNISWIVGHGLKFDFGVLYGRLKLLMRGNIPIWDTLLGMHWLDENRKELGAFLDGDKPYSLKTLGKKFFDFHYKSDHLEARSEGNLADLAFDDFAEYAGSDVIVNLHLYHYQMEMARLQKDNPQKKLIRFMQHYYSPATRAVALMECNGIYVPADHLQFLQGTKSPIWNRLEQIEKFDLQNCQEIIDFRRMYKNRLSGSGINYAEDVWGDEEEDEIPEFNPNKDLHQRLLFAEFLNFRPLKLTAKKKASYDKAFLKHYAEPHIYLEEDAITGKYAKYYATNDEEEMKANPLQLIAEYRELKKLGTTYLAKTEDMILDPTGDCLDSKIRANFHLAGTVTGRTSSSNPNFQNLPSGRTHAAKEIKNMFQAEPPCRRFPEGTCLIQLDYKTAEVRWAAIFAKDQELIKIFIDAKEALCLACDPMSNMTDEDFAKSQLASDLHRRTASLMFGVPADKVEASMRQASKSITFGILYGMSTKTLAATNNWKEDDAEDKVNKFFSALPTLKHWLDAAPRIAKEKGYAETLMGRRRRLAHLFDTQDFKNENKARKLAMNAPIQGQSSDAGILGLVTFVSHLLAKGLERRWLIQNVVHDSCLIQVPFNDIEKALPIIQHCFVEGMAEYLKAHFSLTLPLPIECEMELGLKYGALIKWDGRPKNLSVIIDTLRKQADELWRQPKDPLKYDMLDLVKK